MDNGKAENNIELPFLVFNNEQINNNKHKVIRIVTTINITCVTAWLMPVLPQFNLVSFALTTMSDLFTTSSASPGILDDNSFFSCIVPKKKTITDDYHKR